MVFQFYGKVGTEKTKSQGDFYTADALVTPAVAGTTCCPAAVLVFIYERERNYYTEVM
ncbi:MAG: hypothetical protein ACLTLE_08945 [Lachnospiraceae bacterium]